MKRLSLVMCALAVAVPTFAQDASGKWQLTVTTADSEPRTTSMALKKEGDKLSGTVMGLQGNEIAVAGTQRESDITLSFTAPTQNGPIAISMKGRQDGDSMKGTLQAGTETQGQWTAVRTAVAGYVDGRSDRDLGLGGPDPRRHPHPDCGPEARRREADRPIQKSARRGCGDWSRLRAPTSRSR